MANYVYRNRAGAGEYTDSERTWLSILRYVSVIAFTGGLLCAIFRAAHPVVWALLLLVGFTSATVTVRIMRRGVARYKMHEQQKKKKNATGKRNRR